MFIRLKRVKGISYAYAVKSKWTKKGPRQRVLGYIGKVYAPPEVESGGFLQFMELDRPEEIDGYIRENRPSEVIKELIAWMLRCHGFREDPGLPGLFSRDAVVVDLEGRAVREADKPKTGGKRPNLAAGRKKPKPVAVRLGSDYLCTQTLGALLGFRSSADKGEVALEFAKAFIAAGIPVPKEIFVGLFQRIWKSGQSYVF